MSVPQQVAYPFRVSFLNGTTLGIPICDVDARVVEFVEALPKSSTGKLLWRELQEQEKWA